ncbi:unnamed protein product [Microthlaspi erraticum]|uniref:Aminotransferase-like plant mobile domain-containing protein n=1 Tax=Microthlaspi erraticum TaxID=1685480 RepID=A0A6D2K801_9BRAS|nr:unnamed protein product [Microthlaspi erraticum]
MSLLHEATWRKAGIFDAIMASTKTIHKDSALVFSVAEKWCPKTNSFLFPWGQAGITLEDVKVLLGFSDRGLQYLTTLDPSGKEIKAKLDQECEQIKKETGVKANQVTWAARFMDSGHELEHVAFLASWLGHFVFPSRYYHIFHYHLSIAVHLSRGTRIALAPPVLDHLYKELSHLSDHIRAFNESTSPLTILYMSSLFKLVQVWTWERFRELQPPKPNPMLEGEPRLALWHDLKRRATNVRQILENSTMDSLKLRPYTKPVKNWNVTTVQVTPRICFPESQCSSKENRVVVESSETLTARGDDTSFVHSGCNMNRTSNDGMKIAEVATKRVCEDNGSSKGHCQTEVTSDNDDNLTISGTLMVERRFKKKYSEVENSGGEVSEPLGKRSRLEADNYDSCRFQKLASTRANGEESVLSTETEQRNEETNETGSISGKDMVLSPVDENNSLDPPLGANGGAVEDIALSAPETRQNCDDELDVNGSNGEKETMVDDGCKEPECLLHEDGAIAGDKASSDEKLCTEAENMVMSPSDESNIHITAGDGTQGQDCLLHEETLKSNEQLENLEKRNNDVDEGDNAMGGEKASSKEKEDDVAGDDDVIQEKLAVEEPAIASDDNTQSFEKIKVLMMSLEERIVKAQKNVAWLKERKAMKQKIIASARLS